MIWMANAHLCSDKTPSSADKMEVGVMVVLAVDDQAKGRVLQARPRLGTKRSAARAGGG